MNEIGDTRRTEMLTALAEEFRGERNARMSNGIEQRYGRRGSLSIKNTGEWFDHEEGEGGKSPVGLLMHLASVDKARAVEMASERFDEFEKPIDITIGGKSVYTYRSSDCRPVKRVIRQDGNGTKKIWQESAVEGTPVSELPRQVYKLPTIRAGIESGETLYIVEGERCADVLLNAGLYATTNDQGAGKWTSEHTACLEGAWRIVILPDNDEPGLNHAEKVSNSLAGAGLSCRILVLDDLPEKGDVVDWLELGHSPMELERLAESLYTQTLPPSLTTFADMEFPPMTPILGPFTTQQLNLIFAPAGAGKTMLGLSIAYALAQGQDFIGWKAGDKPLRVLYIDAEMAAPMIQERFGTVRSDRLFIANLHGWGAKAGLEPLNLTTAAGQALVSEWIRELDIDVLFLDNFMTLAWRDGVSFSSDEIWTPVRRWCLELRGDGKTVFIVDHANAHGDVFGTKTKTHQVDITAILEPVGDPEDWFNSESGRIEEQNSRAVLKFKKKRGFSENDSRVADKELEIGPVGIDWKWGNPGNELESDIRAYRKDGLSLRDIAKEMGVSYSKVQRTWNKVQARDSL